MKVVPKLTTELAFANAILYYAEIRDSTSKLSPILESMRVMNTPVTLRHPDIHRRVFLGHYYYTLVQRPTRIQRIVRTAKDIANRSIKAMEIAAPNSVSWKNKDALNPLVYLFLKCSKRKKDIWETSVHSEDRQLSGFINEMAEYCLLTQEERHAQNRKFIREFTDILPEPRFPDTTLSNIAFTTLSGIPGMPEFEEIKRRTKRMRLPTALPDEKRDTLW